MTASTPDSIRAFIAIAVEPALAAAVKNVQQRLNAPRGVVRWINPDHLHLTLQFLGNVAAGQLDDLAAALRRACAQTAPFHLALAGAGCFPSTKNPRVVWIGIQGDLEPLRKLQEQIAQETKTFGDHADGDERAFQPHLTIGRVKAAGLEGRKASQAIEFVTVPKLGDWTVHQVLLVRSDLSPDGARYTTLAAVALNH
jgi:RNA 2',3'-cyclic 3'-phosphodiesterase